MHGTESTNWKKKMRFGASLLVLAVATIVIGIYTTSRTYANQSSSSQLVSGETGTRIDVKVDNGLVEPTRVTNGTESDKAAPSSSQQGGPNPNVKARVNNVSVDVPKNGSVHKEINTQDGSASIDISSQSNTSSGDSRTRSSVNVDIDSSSSVRIQNETRE